MCLLSSTAGRSGTCLRSGSASASQSTPVRCRSDVGDLHRPLLPAPRLEDAQAAPGPRRLEEGPTQQRPLLWTIGQENSGHTGAVPDHDAPSPVGDGHGVSVVGDRQGAAPVGRIGYETRTREADRENV